MFDELKRRTKNAKWLDEAVEYWSSRIYEGDLGCDWSEGDKVCWNCGHCRSLQRCHIVPKSLGGEASASNTVALCAQCHDIAPDVSDPSEIWSWIRSNRIGKSGLYNTYWYEEAIAESGVDLSKFSADRLFALESECGVHFGQLTGRARLKVSTIAWALRKAAANV